MNRMFERTREPHAFAPYFRLRTCEKCDDELSESVFDPHYHEALTRLRPRFKNLFRMHRHGGKWFLETVHLENDGWWRIVESPRSSSMLTIVSYSTLAIPEIPCAK